MHSMQLNRKKGNPKKKRAKPKKRSAAPFLAAPKKEARGRFGFRLRESSPSDAPTPLARCLLPKLRASKGFNRQARMFTDSCAF